jgi:hypothetical protein
MNEFSNTSTFWMNEQDAEAKTAIAVALPLADV